ncbi:MAG TPA: NFACT RNA binding domain-containing protein [Abditibacteriaceae bacterium]|jgi:predicted ribosome quality control (RQC) complex YloA/Tae2 family protein
MIFDSTMLAALAAEMRALRGERLRDIWQASSLPQHSGKMPQTRGNSSEDDDRAVFLAFRSATLLIDTHPQRARLHFVAEAPQPSNTALTTTLRKALRNARLVDVEQPNFDRVLHLRWETRDAIGDLVRYTLVAELMERRSNIILLDESQTIIDAVKRLPPFLNSVRTILPHRPYEPPPSGKANPLQVNDWQQRVLDADLNLDATADDFTAWLRAQFTGISPLVVRSLQAQVRATSAVDARAWASECAAFFEQAQLASNGDFTPVLCGEQPYTFPLSGSDCAPCSGSLSTLIEHCVTREAAAGALSSERARLMSYLAASRKRNAAQQQDTAKALRHAEDAALFNQQGQAILAHIGQVEAALQNGATSIELPLDAWGENPEDSATTCIALEPDWSAADNATRCFNRYRRAHKLAAAAPARREELEAEAAALQKWEEAARAAQNRHELEAIAAASGLHQKDAQREPKPASRTRQESDAARPESKLRRREFESWQLWMGRNALENQLLLSKVASPSDIWMHVRGMPSAHVLIKNQKGKQPPPRVLEEAGRWLASTTRTTSRKTASTRDDNNEGDRIEIIYTEAKWVRSVRGAPGRVTLQRFQTLLVRV